MNILEKYKNKYRVILIYYSDDTKILKSSYNLYKKQLDMLSTIVKFIKYEKFSIKLYGIDGKLKYQTNKLLTSWEKIINIIKNMPMQKQLSNLSLYSDYHPNTSKKNLGFKNIITAINTINAIKNESITYQTLVINTMYNRAKYHPYQTNDMKQAMKIFKKWLLNNKKN